MVKSFGGIINFLASVFHSFLPNGSRAVRGKVPALLAGIPAAGFDKLNPPGGTRLAHKTDNTQSRVHPRKMAGHPVSRKELSWDTSWERCVGQRIAWEQIFNL
jgi:hypothetical protein